MNDERIRQETIQEIADLLDIDEHLIAHYERLQSKINGLKIKFEAHKLTRSNEYGLKRKS